jgi:uncharacterized protein
MGKNLLRIGWRVLLFFALVLSTGFLIGRLVGPWIRGHMRAAGGVAGPRISIVTELLAVCIPIWVATWVMAAIEQRPAWAYGLTETRPVQRFAWGAFWGFLSLSGLVGVLVLTGHLAIDGAALSGFMAFRFAVEWGVAFLLVGIAEEMALRGYLQDVLARGMGFWPAAVLLSIGFGALHLPNSGEGVIGVVTAGLAGLVFCYSLWRSGSLWWAIGAHMGWDWAQSYFYGVPDSGEVVAPHLLVSHPLGAAWLSGGTVGPEGSIFAILALLADAVVIRLTLGAGPNGDPGWLARHREGGDQRASGEVDRVDGARIGAD